MERDSSDIVAHMQALLLNGRFVNRSEIDKKLVEGLIDSLTTLNLEEGKPTSESAGELLYFE